MAIERAAWGTTAQDEPIELFTLSNGDLTLRVMTYGAIIVGIDSPDRHGRRADITLGFDAAAPYLGAHPYFGTLVGRYANRIANARFELDGITYSLPANDGPNCLHGGTRGWDRFLWKPEAGTVAGEPAVQFTLASMDGDQGFPGTVSATVAYTLQDDSTLRVDFGAVVTAPTVINMTQHAYFNLAGGGTIEDHTIQLLARHYLPVNVKLIPTGERAAVAGTPFDLQTPTRIGDRIHAPHEQITRANGGIDHAFVINREDGDRELRPAATVIHEPTGRRLDVATTQPSVQLYTGNFLDGTLAGKGGAMYPKHGGFCLETQHFPDSPNQPAFPSTVLRPGEMYHETATYRITVL